MKQILKVKDWLSKKRTVYINTTPISSPTGTLFYTARYAIKFEIKKGKTESTFIEINDDGEIDYKF